MGGAHSLLAKWGRQQPLPPRMREPWECSPRRACTYSLALSAHSSSQTPGPEGGPRRTMNEAKESLRSIEQKYKLFQQQQFTFVAALEHCRENAHDKIKPITSIEQVASRGGAGRAGTRAPARPGDSWAAPGRPSLEP